METPDVIDLVLVSLLLTLKRFHTLFWCFHCWLLTSKYRLRRGYIKLEKTWETCTGSCKSCEVRRWSNNSWVLAIRFSDCFNINNVSGIIHTCFLHTKKESVPRFLQKLVQTKQKFKIILCFSRKIVFEKTKLFKHKCLAT